MVSSLAGLGAPLVVLGDAAGAWRPVGVGHFLSQNETKSHFMKS
jgi:hypothetical protein